MQVRALNMLLILARLKDQAQAVLSILPAQEREKVILSDLSVDVAVHQALTLARQVSQA